MPGSLSRMQENAREQFLSSDLNRAQQIGSRELQNILGDDARSASGAPGSCLLGPCGLTGIGGGFQMAIPAAQALAYLPGDVGLTADDSPFEVARWVGQNLTFSNPDGGSPRIDLVCVTPAMVGTDAQSRTILVDPVTRAVAMQSVNKTVNPLCVPQVVAGTPSGTPGPPAVPAGSVALFEVYVPAAAADATAFHVLPRLWRRVGFPLSGQSGILAGMRLHWNIAANPATTSSTLTLEAGLHQLLVDGELVEWSGAAAISPDAGAASPFAASAPANSCVPYFIYAVGGRHSPQSTQNGQSPIAIVESLTPPDVATGKPTVAITPPRGGATIDGAVYVGLGFVVNNSTRRLACIMDDQMTLTQYSLGSINHTLTATASELIGNFSGTCQPSISTKMRAALSYFNNGGAAAPSSFSIGAPVALGGVQATTPFVPAGQQGVVHPVDMVWGSSPSDFWGFGATGDQVQVNPYGFDHRVRRFMTAI